MADRDNYEPDDLDDERRRRDRDRDLGRRFESERPSWRGEDRGHHEGGTYGQQAWRGSAQRSRMHEDQRYGPRHDTGEAWGNGGAYREQAGREDFGQYGRTGAGGDFGHRPDHHGVTSRQFGHGGYGRGGGRGRGDLAGQGGSAFGAGGYPAYGPQGRGGQQSGSGEPVGSTGREFAGDFDHGRRDYGYGERQHDQHQHSHAASPYGDFEPDYVHWRESEMRKLDEDYRRWREERRSKFAQEFDDWRRRRSGHAADADDLHRDEKKRS